MDSASGLGANRSQSCSYDEELQRCHVVEGARSPRVAAQDGRGLRHAAGQVQVRLDVDECEYLQPIITSSTQALTHHRALHISLQTAQMRTHRAARAFGILFLQRANDLAVLEMVVGLAVQRAVQAEQA